jgi:hypothetical protein
MERLFWREIATIGKMLDVDSDVFTPQSDHRSGGCSGCTCSDNEFDFVTLIKIEEITSL